MGVQSHICVPGTGPSNRADAKANSGTAYRTDRIAALQEQRNAAREEATRAWQKARSTAWWAFGAGGVLGALAGIAANAVWILHLLSRGGH